MVKKCCKSKPVNKKITAFNGEVLYWYPKSESKRAKRQTARVTKRKKFKAHASVFNIVRKKLFFETKD